MDRFLEKFNLPRLNHEEIEITTRLQALKLKLWAKISQKTKVQDKMASQENSIKHLEKSHCYPSKALLKNWRGKNTSNFILQCHHHTDTETKDNTQKEKLQANITGEHRCKNPQQNFSKQNSATHQKAHTPWSSWVLQYTEIN